MKPFDLTAAKAGAPLITRDGRPAKFVAHWDGTDDGIDLVVFIEGNLCFRLGNGVSHKATSGDLFMAPRKVVKWGVVDVKNGTMPHQMLMDRDVDLAVNWPRDIYGPCRVEWEE